MSHFETGSYVDICNYFKHWYGHFIFSVAVVTVALKVFPFDWEYDGSGAWIRCHKTIMFQIPQFWVWRCWQCFCESKSEERVLLQLITASTLKYRVFSNFTDEGLQKRNVEINAFLQKLRVFSSSSVSVYLCSLRWFRASFLICIGMSCKRNVFYHTSQCLPKILGHPAISCF